MQDIVLQVRPITDELLKKDEGDLYIELGRRIQAIKENPSVSGSFSPEINTTVEALGAVDDLKIFGQNLFKRINIQAYSLVCGQDKDNTEDRERMLDAFGIGKEAVAAALAGLLMNQLGLSPALAPVVAVLIINLFFKPAIGSMCDIWKENLP